MARPFKHLLIDGIDLLMGAGALIYTASLAMSGSWVSAAVSVMIVMVLIGSMIGQRLSDDADPYQATPSMSLIRGAIFLAAAMFFGSGLSASLSAAMFCVAGLLHIPLAYLANRELSNRSAG